MKKLEYTVVIRIRDAGWDSPENIEGLLDMSTKSQIRKGLVSRSTAEIFNVMAEELGINHEGDW